ncbi:MAG: PAS domain S-box protein [Chloroflexi bacterium]|nr:PAS domain S-box protein [Chloroflexota bacterium]
MSEEDIGILREQLRLATEDLSRFDELLDHSEKRYQLLSDNANSVVFFADMQGRITYVCGSLERLLGYPPGEVTGRVLGSAWHLVAVQRVIATAETHGGGKSDARVEHQLRRKDGSTVWIEFSVSLLRDAEGRVTGVVGRCRDITEHKRADLAMQESEEKFRKVYEDSPVGIVWQPSELQQGMCPNVRHG